MYRIIPFEPRYAAGVVDVVRAIHDEFGFSWDADGYHRDLYEIEQTYLREDGMFDILLFHDQVVACVGVTLHDRNRAAHDPQGSAPIENNPQLRYSELHRLYVLSPHRGKGWGRKLLERSIDFSREKGCTRMVCWSDTVLKDAHSLYLRSGFVQCDSRICNDPDHSREFGFWKEPL